MVRLAGQVSMFIFSYPLVIGSLIGHPLAKKLSTAVKDSFSGNNPGYEHSVERSETHHLNM